MRKYLILLVLTGPSIVTFSQNGISAIDLVGSFDYYIYDASISINNQGLDLTNALNHSLGISATIPFKELWNGRVGLLYATKTFDIDYLIRRGNPDDPITTTIRNVWLDIPLLLDYRFSRARPFEVYGVIGLVPGVFLKSNEKTTYSELPEQRTQVFTEEFKNVVIGANGGVRLVYNFKPLRIGAEPYIRYYLNKANAGILDELPYSFGAMLFASYIFQ